MSFLCDGVVWQPAMGRLLGEVLPIQIGGARTQREGKKKGIWIGKSKPKTLLAYVTKEADRLCSMNM